MRMQRTGGLVALITLVGVAGLTALPAAAADTPAVVINEVESNGDSTDWIEIMNVGSSAIDISGWVLLDNKDTEPTTIPAGTTLAAGEIKAFDSVAGLGGGDSARVFDAAMNLVATYTWSTHAATTYGRCPDGSGDLVTTDASTKGAANDCPAPAPDPDPEPVPDPDPSPSDVETYLVVNEVETSGVAGLYAGEDWIELKNTGSMILDVSGVVVADENDEEQYTIPAGTTIAAGGYLVLVGETDFTYGLGKGDSVRLFVAGTANTASATAFESYTWPNNHAAITFGRCPDGTGEFAETTAATPGAANTCGTVTPEEPVAEPDELSTTLAINEIESNGDDTDWVEVINLTASPIDISGWAIKDNDNTRPDVVPAGSIVPANGLLVIDQKTQTYPQGFDYGLGTNDMFRLYNLSGELVAKASWGPHAATSYGRCPDGTGALVTTTATTKGAANDCSVPLRINEVESSGGTPGDWIELVNAGSSTLDVSGFVVKDNDDTHVYTIPAGTLLDAGEYLVIDEETLGFGLSSADSVRVFAADGTTSVASYTWTTHAAVTYGRCPDITGDFEVTLTATKGAANSCAGYVTAQPWPGGSDISIIDTEAQFGGDLSGIDFDSTTGELWAVENGGGLLFRFVQDAGGDWVSASGWEAGKTLRYPGGAGMVDSEGVTVTSAGSAGGVYVASERNNAASSVSRPAVLRYDINGTGGELTATAEWNLAADFPGLAANQGLEGITWVSDAFLTARGFIDANTSAAYVPGDYPGHGSGLFLVGVEGTAAVYAYALMDGGTFERIATISTEGASFALVADVQFDSQRGVLFVVCDEACDGRIAAYTITDGAFALDKVYERPSGMPNIGNEGFALGDTALCSADGVPAFWVDDNDTDGFSLRTGTFPCTTPAVNVTPPTQPVVGGDSVTVSLGAAYAGRDINVWMHSTAVFLGSFTANSSGAVSITVPSTAPLGEHLLVLLAGDGTLVARTDVTVAAGSGGGSGTGGSGTGGTGGTGTGTGTGTTGQRPTLAFTGVEDAALLSLVSLALLGAGIGLTMLRRRRA